MLIIDASFSPGYIFYSNDCWTLGPFMSRFEFGPRTYPVMLFIYFIKSSSRFAFNWLFMLVFLFKYCFMSKIIVCRVINFVSYLNIVNWFFIFVFVFNYFLYNRFVIKWRFSFYCHHPVFITFYYRILFVFLFAFYFLFLFLLLWKRFH